MARPFNMYEVSNFLDFFIDGSRLDWTVYGYTTTGVKILFKDKSRKVCEDWLENFMGE